MGSSSSASTMETASAVRVPERRSMVGEEGESADPPERCGCGGRRWL